MDRDELSHEAAVALRDVGKLLVRADYCDQLLNQICAFLVSSRGYADVWICVIGAEQLIVHQAESGCSRSHTKLTSREMRPPPCVIDVLQRKEIILSGGLPECPACRSLVEKEALGVLCAPVTVDDKVLGAILTAMDKSLLSDPSERALICELAGDLGYCLRRFEAEERRAQTVEALRENEQLYRAIVETSPDAITLTDLQGMFIASNDRAAQMHGAANVDEFLASAPNAFELIVPEERPRALENAQKTLEIGWCRNIEYTLRRSDGSTFDAEVNTSVFRDAQGSPKGFVGTIRDISERRRVEAERATMEAQLRHQQKLESLGTLASGVAHEINTPVNVVMNYAELTLREVDEGDTIAEYARQIISESQRIADIVRALLAFARQDSDKVEPCCVRDLIESTLSLIGQVLAKDQIKVVVDVDENLPDIACRQRQLHQVLLNLLTNARDALNQRFPGYDDEKIIVLSVERNEQKGKPYVRTTVEDHGVGIDPDDIDRIFDPFFTSKPSESGTGLGLSVSHGIIADHGGRLTAESKQGEYTRIHMDLPVEE
jgi:PAS domain S-box-containing protein